MAGKPPTQLSLGLRLRVFHDLSEGRPLSSLVDSMPDDEEVVALQRFVWDRTVELGLGSLGDRFSRRDITARMVPTREYLRQNNCTRKIYTCKATQCIRIHPECARRKIKGQLDAMAEAAGEYVRLARSRAKAPRRPRLP